MSDALQDSSGQAPGRPTPTPTNPVRGHTRRRGAAAELVRHGYLGLSSGLAPCGVESGRGLSVRQRVVSAGVGHESGPRR
jgi:hypothetical protein